MQKPQIILFRETKQGRGAVALRFDFKQEIIEKELQKFKNPIDDIFNKK